MSHIVVTGSAAGLGQAIASALLAAGQPVVILDRDVEQATVAARTLGDRHRADVPVVVADLSTVGRAGARLSRGRRRRPTRPS